MCVRRPSQKSRAASIAGNTAVNDEDFPSGGASYAGSNAANAIYTGSTRSRIATSASEG
jgi:hypothetical protein